MYLLHFTGRFLCRWRCSHFSWDEDHFDTSGSVLHFLIQFEPSLSFLTVSNWDAFFSLWDEGTKVKGLTTFKFERILYPKNCWKKIIVQFVWNLHLDKVTVHGTLSGFSRIYVTVRNASKWGGPKLLALRILFSTIYVLHFFSLSTFIDRISLHL